MNKEKRDFLKSEIKKLITGEFKNQLKEASTTGGVAGYSTPFAFSKNAKGNVRAATNSTGYKLVSKKDYNTESLNEDVDYNVKADYEAFMAKEKASDFALETEIKTKLNKQLAGKTVMIHGSKGYKQFKKDYEVQVKTAKIDDYYGNFEVVLVGNDGKEYFVDRNFKIKIVGNAVPAEQPETQPEAKPVEKPAQPLDNPQKKVEEPVEPAGTAPKTDLSKELKK